MHISDLIAKLTKLQIEHGDLHVAMLTETPDGWFMFDLQPQVDMIEYPASKHEKHLEQVVAIAWNGIAIEGMPRETSNRFRVIPGGKSEV